MENKEKETKILNNNEMEQVAGGFVYDGVFEWLKGFNITCPNCANEEEASLRKRYATGIHVYYTCEKCGQKFYCVLGPGNKVKVYKEKQ